MKKQFLEIVGGFITTLKRAFHKRDTLLYPEQPSTHSKRWRGKIVLTRDPDGEERCVACYLCSSVCPVDCINIQGTEAADERRYPETFEINFGRCIFCGLCEEACPTLAIQLTQDFKFCEQDRTKMLYRKEDLLIDGTGKHPHYNFYRHAGVSLESKPVGSNTDELKPVDVFSPLP